MQAPNLVLPASANDRLELTRQLSAELLDARLANIVLTRRVLELEQEVARLKAEAAPQEAAS